MIPNIRVAVILALLTSGFLLFAGAGPASAHENDEGIIAVIDERRVVVTAAVAFDELGYIDTSGDGLLDGKELAAQQQAVAASLVDTARDNVELTIDGEPAEIIGAGVPALSESEAESGTAPYVVLVLASGPHDGDVNKLELTWDFDSSSTAVMLSNSDGAVTGDFADDGTIAFSLDAWSSAISFFELGIDHIRYGPDHLLFLLVLTLAATGTTITSTTARRTVKLVTAFTAGHAISLGLAYYELVSIPAAIVEPAISLSIVAVAVLAIRNKTTEARPIIAGFVGVIHGLGFASNLSSLGVTASQQIAALAAFNVGVDVAQTVVVLLVIGGLWLSNYVLAERSAWIRMAAATGAAVFGLIWTATRLAELTA